MSDDAWLRAELAKAISEALDNTVAWCPHCGREHRIGDLGAPFICIVGPDGRGPELRGLTDRGDK